MSEGSNINYEDARIITQLVKEYFERLNPQLGFLLFRIESLSPNTKPGVWVVKCSFKASFGSNKRLYYELHVSKDGTFEEVKKIAEDEN